jgi:hypothetical protein
MEVIGRPLAMLYPTTLVLIELFRLIQVDNHAIEEPTYPCTCLPASLTDYILIRVSRLAAGSLRPLSSSARRSGF